MKLKRVLNYLILLVLISAFLGTEATARPAIAIVFDDGWTSQYYKAFPIMQNNNQRGTIFVITGEVGRATGLPGQEYMNISELNSLYNAGWDLSSHTVTHPSLVSLSTSNLNTELSASRSWLNSAGFSRGSMFLAYPYGDYDSTVINALKSNGYLAARTVLRTCAERNVLTNCYTFPDLYPRYNSTSTDRYEMLTLLADGTNDNNGVFTPPAYIIDEINKTINSDGFLIITFHNLVDSNPKANEDYIISNFKIISDYLKSRSYVVDTVTLSQFFTNIITPTPTPIPTVTPTPTVTSTAVPTPNPTSTVTSTAVPTPTPTVTPVSNSVKIYPDNDAWITQASPTNNYGFDTEIVINHAANAEEVGLIHYNLSIIPVGATIISANQYMYLEYTSANTLKINRLKSDFIEGTVNWNTRPTVGEFVSSYTINPSSVGWKSMNVTNIVQNWYNGIWSNNGIYINSTIDDEAAFTSRGGANKPYIIVNYTTATPTSTPTPTETVTSTPIPTVTVTSTPIPTVTATTTPSAIKIYPTADTYVSTSNPNTNYGNSNYLSTNVASNGSVARAMFIKYNFSQIPIGATIINATQYMYLSYSVGAGQKLTFNKLNSDFGEFTVNWNNKPIIGQQIIEYPVSPLSSGWKIINVTAFVKNWYDGSWPNYGFYANSTNSNDDFVIVSKEGGTNKEYIIVNYR